MTDMRRSVFLLLLSGSLLGAGSLGLAGCEDSAAATRNEVQRTLDSVSQQFERSRIGNLQPGDDQFESVRSDLNDLIGQLSRINEGAAGQQAAGALLAAEALRELALSDQLQAFEREMDLQRERSLVRQKINGLRRHHRTARALGAVTTQSERAQLQQLRQATQQQLEQLNDQLDRLRDPIAENRSLNERDSERVVELRDQANEMLRRASELGPADGFATFQSAIEHRREADGIEYRISQRMIDLNFELTPDEQLTQDQIRQLQRLADAVAEAVDQVQRFESQFEEIAGTMRQRRDALRNEISESLSSIASGMGSDLQDMYASARENFDRAATQAQQAISRARGGATDHFRLVEARIHESHSRLAWYRASGLEDQVRLLQQVVEAGSAMSNVARYQDELDDTRRQRDEAISDARAAAEAAVQSLSMLTGTAAERATVFRRNMELILAALEGEDVDLTVSPDDLAPDLPPIEDVDDPDDPDAPEAPDAMDPSQLGGQMDQEMDRAQLLAMLDMMDFSTVMQTLEAQGLADQIDEEMREQLRPAFDAAVEAVRDQVEAGEISTPMQLQEALMQQMFAQMSPE